MQILFRQILFRLRIEIQHVAHRDGHYPQLQGIRWIKNKESKPERNVQIVRLGQKDIVRKLESALENGHTILIENLGETLETVLNPVIQRATIKRGSRYFIKIGDKECDFHPNIRLFLHTKLSNPHYPPEIQAETTLINFTLTKLGQEDQSLKLVVERERPDLASLSEELVKKQNSFTIKIKQLEDNILSKLASAEEDITEYGVMRVHSLSDRLMIWIKAQDLGHVIHRQVLLLLLLDSW